MASSSKSASAAKRLMHELQDLSREPNPAVLRVGPVSDDELMLWTAVLKGVDGTAYEGGLWQLNIAVSTHYPHTPPTITFATPICHPNVHFKTGEICLDLLKTSWSPAYTISSTLTSIQQLLTSAEPDSPLNVDIAQLFRQNDLVGAEGLIRFYTKNIRWEER